MASIEEAKEIIKSTPISSVINYYHPISKRGANYEGICPFHGDTSPSLKIHDGKGIYKCFACGAAGDAIKFVQDKLNLEFIDAIKDISSNIGISIDEFKAKNKDPKFDMALRVLSASHKIYKKVATEVNPEHFKEFLKQRNINEQSVTDFQIGFAPANNAVTKYLNSITSEDKSKAVEVASQIGLIRQDKSGKGHYDFYRDRIIFPIWDHSGKVRGYSSRAVKPDQKPKYLNSGESFIFDKGNILYGFNLAKSHIREQDSVIIVEGNMDALMLHQFGFKNAVATMGVSLSVNSIKMLSNMTKNFYLAMDSDPAGLKAMQRINEDLMENDIIAKFLSFAPAKDPDEYLNEFGRLKLIDVIDNAPSFIDYSIQKIIPDPIPASTDRKLNILNEIFMLLSPMGSSLFAVEKLIQCAKTIGLKSSAEDIKTEYLHFLDNKKERFKPKKIAREQLESMNTEASDLQENSNMNPAIETMQLSKAQKNILEILIRHPDCSEDQQIAEILDLIDHFEVKRIVQWVSKLYREIDEVDYKNFVLLKLNETLPAEIRKIMATTINSFEPVRLSQKVVSKTLADLIIKLKNESLIKERDALRAKQKLSQTDDESLEIITEIQKLEKKLLELRNK